MKPIIAHLKRTALTPRTILFFAWLLGAPLSFSAADGPGALAENRLSNPSFEVNSPGGVEGWTYRAWSGGDEARHEVVTPGRNGGHCVSIRSAKGSDAAWTARVAVQEGKSYELSGWIKTDSVKGAAGALLNIQNLQPVKTTAVTGTSDWRQVRVAFEVGAKRELEINCLFGGWGKATGQAWFDDVAVREISREELARPKMEGEVLRGMNGLVATPAMGDAEGLPRRLMGVGVDDRGKVFVTETVRLSKEEISLLQSKFLHEADMGARIHGLWGLTQLKRWDAEVVEHLATSSDDELQAQFARYVGDVGRDPSGSKWAAALLEHRSPRVKMLASIACGKLRVSSATTSLLAMIHEARDTSPVLREAGVAGLMGAATPAELEKLSSNASEAVRIAAMVALRRLGATKELVSFLGDTSTQVRSDAVLGIYDAAVAQTFEKSPQALAAVAQKLAPSSPAAINVRALAANRRLGTRGAIARIAAFLTAADNQRQTERIMAMDILASWSESATLDPVDGRYFPVPAFSAEDLEAELAPHIWTLASDRDLLIAERAIALSARMKVSEDRITRGAAAIMDESLALPLRLAWFQWLQKRNPERAVDVAVTALTSAGAEVRLAAANHLLDRNLKTNEVCEQVKEILRGSKDVRELQGALGLLKKVPASEAALRDLVADLSAGKIAASIQLDVIEAARAASAKNKELAALIAAYDDGARVQNPFGEFSVALEGGDAERGKSLFLGHTTAMCSKCHALKQTDQQVGPSLEGVATRLTRAELLESMLDPQARVAPGYGVQMLELNDGRSIAGTQMSETNKAIVLKSPDGKFSTHPKATIKSMTKPIGVMPPMKTLLSIREMRDVVAFLSTLQPSK